MGIEPNGEAWSGILQQCAGRTKKTEDQLPNGANFDPEAGSFAVYVKSRADADRVRAIICRALDDEAWLDRCLKSIDRSKLDD
jgi:hypothetical protein